MSFLFIVISIAFVFLIFCGPKAHWALLFPLAQQHLQGPFCRAQRTGPQQHTSSLPGLAVPTAQHGLLQFLLPRTSLCMAIQSLLASDSLSPNHAIVALHGLLSRCLSSFRLLRDGDKGGWKTKVREPNFLEGIRERDCTKKKFRK